MLQTGSVVISTAGKDRDGFLVVVRHGRRRMGGGRSASPTGNPQAQKSAPSAADALPGVHVHGTNRELRRALTACRQAADAQRGVTAPLAGRHDH